MSADPRFLVVDGYSKAGRDELVAGGASMAGDLYAAMLRRFAPGAAVDIVFPADSDSGLPSGADIGAYDGIAWTGCSLTAYDDAQLTPALLQRLPTPVAPPLPDIQVAAGPSAANIGREFRNFWRRVVGGDAAPPTP